VLVNLSISGLSSYRSQKPGEMTEAMILFGILIEAVPPIAA
jgi:hypothetical protein